MRDQRIAMRFFSRMISSRDSVLSWREYIKSRVLVPRFIYKSISLRFVLFCFVFFPPLAGKIAKELTTTKTRKGLRHFGDIDWSVVRDHKFFTLLRTSGWKEKKKSYARERCFFLSLKFISQREHGVIQYWILLMKIWTWNSSPLLCDLVSQTEYLRICVKFTASMFQLKAWFYGKWILLTKLRVRGAY